MTMGLGRVTFLAHKEVIQSLIEKGYPKKMIHQLYEPQLRIGYAQFCEYIRRYIGDVAPRRSGAE